MSWTEVKKINSDMTKSLDERIDEASALMGDRYSSLSFSWPYPYERKPFTIVEATGKGCLFYFSFTLQASAQADTQKASNANLKVIIDDSTICDVTLIPYRATSDSTNYNLRLDAGMVLSKRLQVAMSSNYYIGIVPKYNDNIGLSPKLIQGSSGSATLSQNLFNGIPYVLQGTSSQTAYNSAKTSFIGIDKPIVFNNSFKVILEDVAQDWSTAHGSMSLDGDVEYSLIE